MEISRSKRKAIELSRIRLAEKYSKVNFLVLTTSFIRLSINFKQSRGAQELQFLLITSKITKEKWALLAFIV